MIERWLPIVVGLAMMTASCAAGSDGRDWDTSLDPVVRAGALGDGPQPPTSADYELRVAADPFGAADARCLQLIVDDTAVGCIPINRTDASTYGFNTAARAGTERVIWDARTITDDQPTPDRFVVWSSTSPLGRRIEPVIHDGTVSIVWVMHPGEAPWGFQSVADDGSLIDSRSFVGLPGE